ncbi:MAG TPA: hypothetical protein VMX13_16155 [Sedimentisphaerales bacterium]|nr:hypothetical protein [Sedimentisphaerales bacterium]
MAEPAFFIGAFRILFVLIISGGILAVFLAIFYIFYNKRVEHKQIMTAMEKGIPLSDLRPAKPAGSVWIRNLTAGIGLAILAAGFMMLGWDAFEHWIGRGPFGSPVLSEYLQVGPFILGVIVLGLGVSRIIRGLLQRKAERAGPPVEKRPNWRRDLAVGIALVVPVPAFLVFGLEAFLDWALYGTRLEPGQKFVAALFVSGLILPAFGVLYLLRGFLQWRAARPTEALSRHTSGITNFAVGIALLLPVLPLLMIGVNAFRAWIGLRFHELSPTEQSMIAFFLLGVILLPFGVFFIVRGYLHLKAERPYPPVEKHPNWMRNLAVGIALLIPVPAFLLFGRNAFWAWVFYHQGNLTFADKFMLVLFISGLILPAFGIFHILRAILQRKAERRAFAIEKGIPLSQLEPSAWITNISIGIGLFVLSLPLLLNFWQIFEYTKRVDYSRLVPLMLFWAVALGLLIRGLLLRKAARQARPADRSNAGERETAGGTSNLEK